jgi:choline dehydrogenase
VFAISPGLMGSASTGCLTVRDVNAAGPAAVEVDSGFLTEQSDLDALVEAMDMIMDLAATSAYAELIDRPLMPAARLSRADKQAFVRENCATFNHACGTAAMGAGPQAVVDPELRVIGVEGLHVADASVIPVIPTGNTQAAVVAIAERAAELIAGPA